MKMDIIRLTGTFPFWAMCVFAVLVSIIFTAAYTLFYPTGEAIRERFLKLVFLSLLSFCFPVLFANRILESEPILRLVTLFVLLFDSFAIAQFTSVTTAAGIYLKQHPKEMMGAQPALQKLAAFLFVLGVFTITFFGWNGLLIIIVSVASGFIRELFDGGLIIKIESGVKKYSKR